MSCHDIFKSTYVHLLAIFATVVSCPELNKLDNGMTNCSQKEFFYEDTCSFTCNTGYKLTGSDTRTCQSNGSWSGSKITCRKG